jgi:hypothetical protein
VLRGLVLRAEVARRLEDELDAEVAPLDVRRVLLARDEDALLVDEELAGASRVEVALEAA